MKKLSKSVDPFSRRHLLKSLFKTIFAGIVLGIMFARPVLSKFIHTRQTPVFPKGSIFTPAEDKSKRT
tara:strand:- start:201 stop:404 length:204 start_codon:yes stop_codon:yes gene_type:complete